MFAELSITSNFTFLTGAPHPEDYAERAALLGLPAIAVADWNSVAGIVRAHTAAREIGRVVKDRQKIEARDGLIGPPAPESAPPGWAVVPRLIPAARIQLTEGVEVTALPKTRVGWGHLCRLISRGRLRAEKGTCDLGLADLLEWGADMALLLHPPARGAPETCASSASSMFLVYTYT